jgi:hypothetical protein
MTRSSRAAVFAAILACHACLLLWRGSPSLLRELAHDEPLQLMQLPAPVLSEIPASASLRGRQRQRHDSAAVPSAAAPAQGELSATAVQAPAKIDWFAEAQLTANRQAAPSIEPHSLDDHSRHGSHEEGLGLREISKPKFAWYYAGTHRFDTSGDLPVIRLNDRCVVPIGLMIPLPLCRIGKIPARGDLFDHMRDVPDATSATPP